MSFGPKMAPQGSHVLHRLAKRNMKNLLVRNHNEYRRMAENGFAPPNPALGNFADIFYLVEN